MYFMERMTKVLNDWFRYFGKYVLILGLIFVFLKVATYMVQHDMLLMLFVGTILLLCAWYAYARAKIDKEYRDSVKEWEERQKQPQKKSSRRGAY